MQYGEYLSGLNKCPFCLPLNQEKIFENDSGFITYNLAPYHHDHLLIVSNRHIEHFWDITKEEMSGLEDLQRKSVEILKKLNYEDMTIFIREGSRSGKTIPHIHFHVVPELVITAEGKGGKKRPLLSIEERAKTLERMRSAL